LAQFWDLKMDKDSKPSLTDYVAFVGAQEINAFIFVIKVITQSEK
jgi:hypothetical protein